MNLTNCFIIETSFSIMKTLGDVYTLGEQKII